MGDIYWLLSSPHPHKDILTFFSYHHRTRYDVLSLKDPLPALGVILEGFLGLMNRDRRRHALKRTEKVEK